MCCGAIAKPHTSQHISVVGGGVVESLMRAHIAHDDKAAAEGVYREHAAALAQTKLGDPADAIEALRVNTRL